jgi:hypothetical protein
MPSPLLSPAAPASHLRFAASRPAARYPCELQASCQPLAAWLDKESVWPGLISDLSTCSLALVLGRRFEPGSGLAVELPATADRCEETLLVKVTKVQSLPDGRWLLSCALVSELSEDTVLTLVSQGEDGPPAALPDDQAPAEGGQGQGPALGDLFGRIVARVRELPPNVRLGMLVLGPLSTGMAFSGIVRLVRWASGG